jgi:transposase
LGWLVGQHYRGRGRKAKLSSEQKQALYALVVSGPQANGFDCGVWTSAMLVELIWRRWGVCYNPRYLSSLLEAVLKPIMPVDSVADESC